MIRIELRKMSPYRSTYDTDSVYVCELDRVMRKACNREGHE